MGSRPALQIPPDDHTEPRGVPVWLWLWLVACRHPSTPEVITFSDTSRAAGFDHLGPSYGTAWGDIDADGRPDLWVGNHADPPSLYMNQGDGTFSEEAAQRVAGALRYDAHGAAFVDWDGDGDDDLFEAVGAEKGTGSGGHRMWRNDDGTLRDVAESLGVRYEFASGRSPLWVDANEDGVVDLLLVAQQRADGLGATAMFHGAPDGFSTAATLAPAQDHDVALYATLADLDGDDRVELIRVGRPDAPRIQRVGDLSFGDIRTDLELPSMSLVFDVVIGDVNGDDAEDLYVLRHKDRSELREAARAVDAALRVQGDTQGVTVTFTGTGSLAIEPPWFWTADDVRLGSACARPETTSFDLDPASIDGRCPFTPGVDRGVFVARVGETWSVELSSPGWERGNLSITAPSDLAAAPIGFAPPDADTVATEDRDRLFLRERGGAFVDRSWPAGLHEAAPCTSGAAGDFDNDMDLDLFLVCGSGTENLPDRVLINEHGVFRAAVEHGAEGPDFGMGDSVAMADYDGDGGLDLFVTNGAGAPPFNLGPHTLLRNTSPRGHWLEVDLVGPGGSADAIGAIVRVIVGPTLMRRTAGANQHHMAQHHGRLHFGLGTATVVDVEVVWPDGEVQTVWGAEADQILRIEREPR